VETPWSNSTRLEINASRQTVEDLIYWKKTYDNVWKPLNLKAASIRTADVSLSQNLWPERIRLQAATNWTEAKDATDDRNRGGRYLTFRPLNSQRIGLTCQNRHLSAGINWRRVSKRAVLETNSKWLGAYQLLDARIGYTFRMRRVEMNPEIGVDNMFNENYRIIRFAPMPLSEWFLTVRVSAP